MRASGPVGNGVPELTVQLALLCPVHVGQVSSKELRVGRRHLLLAGGEDGGASRAATRRVVERLCVLLVRPLVVSRPGRQVDVLQGGLLVSAQVHVVEAGLFSRLVVLVVMRRGRDALCSLRFCIEMSIQRIA